MLIFTKILEILCFSPFVKCINTFLVIGTLILALHNKLTPDPLLSPYPTIDEGMGRILVICNKDGVHISIGKAA